LGSWGKAVAAQTVAGGNEVKNTRATELIPEAGRDKKLDSAVRDEAIDNAAFACSVRTEIDAPALLRDTRGDGPSAPRAARQ